MRSIANICVYAAVLCLISACSGSKSSKKEEHSLFLQSAAAWCIAGGANDKPLNIVDRYDDVLQFKAGTVKILSLSLSEKNKVQFSKTGVPKVKSLGEESYTATANMIAFGSRTPVPYKKVQRTIDDTSLTCIDLEMVRSTNTYCPCELSEDK